MIKFSPNEECPCDSGKKYKKCCRPYLEGKVAPPTPEALVRARFTAYGVRNIDFIMDTTHSESPHFNANEHRWRAELDAYALRSMFTVLKVLSAEEDKVSYEVRMWQFGVQESRYIEHATFRQKDGKWYYFDSTMEDVEDEAAVDADSAASVNETPNETEES